MKNYGIIIPIRLASERLPNKAIMEICSKPIVCHLLDRAYQSSFIRSKKQVVVCTTENIEDDQLVKIVQDYGASVFRGSTNDIIKRFYDAIVSYSFDAVIQIDGDDPLCDPQYMDLTMQNLIDDPTLDIVTCEDLPLGIGSKSFTRSAMEKVYKIYKTTINDTGYIYYFTKTNSCNIKIIKPIKKDHIFHSARLTLDYPEDLALFEKIFELLYDEQTIFSLDEILNLLRVNPELLKINNSMNDIYWQRTKERIDLTYDNGEGIIKRINDPSLYFKRDE